MVKVKASLMDKVNVSLRDIVIVRIKIKIRLDSGSS